MEKLSRKAMESSWKLSHIVLVHYLEEEGKKASVICSKEYEESNPCAQQTYKVMANTEMETSRSSNLHPHSYHIHLQTNGAQASECEEAELAFNSEANSDLHSFLELQCPVSQKIKTQLVGSNCSLPLKDDQERLPVFRQVDYIPLSQANETRHINNVGSACEPSKLLGYYSSWQHILDNTAASYDELFQPSFPEIQSNNMEINSTSQQYEVMGQPFSSTITKQHQNGSLIQSVGNWQATGFNSLTSWLLDGDHSVSTCEISYNNNEQEELSKPSTSNAYWDTIESENGFDSTIIPSQDHFDDCVLCPSIFCDHLFSIINISPSWTFEDSEIKVFIFGQFLKSQQEAEVCKWSCMFGEVEVPAEIIGDGVFCCRTPPHKVGRVHFYVTCSNRLACSEVHEFDFRVNTSQEINTAG
ncbi:calmodulin-binding protein [Medicago truncatula]|uniref:Calmodulin-binding protein n=1 Tax=Medicago truncatula TaxID=3880 RepID=A0A072TUI4_MEDTR|nr:calmodulin-binding protein [Medicago truncatula]